MILIITNLLFLLTLTTCVNSGKNLNILSERTKPVMTSEAGVISGEYIVIVRNNCDEFLLRKFFYEYGIKEITSIRLNVYLIKFASDPGYKELLKESDKTNSIEDIKPNYRK